MFTSYYCLIGANSERHPKCATSEPGYWVSQARSLKVTVTPFITSAKEVLFSSLFVSRITQKLLNRFFKYKIRWKRCTWDTEETRVRTIRLTIRVTSVRTVLRLDGAGACHTPQRCVCFILQLKESFGPWYGVPF